MARPFSYPEVQKLKVGGWTSIRPKSRQDAARKIAGFAKRSNRVFALGSAETVNGAYIVTRLPDPEPRAE